MPPFLTRARLIVSLHDQAPTMARTLTVVLALFGTAGIALLSTLRQATLHERRDRVAGAERALLAGVGERGVA